MPILFTKDNAGVIHWEYSGVPAKTRVQQGKPEVFVFDEWVPEQIALADWREPPPKESYLYFPIGLAELDFLTLHEDTLHWYYTGKPVKITSGNIILGLDVTYELDKILEEFKSLDDEIAEITTKGIAARDFKRAWPDIVIIAKQAIEAAKHIAKQVGLAIVLGVWVLDIPLSYKLIISFCLGVYLARKVNTFKLLQNGQLRPPLNFAKGVLIWLIR